MKHNPQKAGGWEEISDVIFTPKRQSHLLRNIAVFLLICAVIGSVFFILPASINFFSLSPTTDDLELSIDKFECNHPSLTRDYILNTRDWQMWMLSIPFQMKGSITNTSGRDVKNVKIKIRFFGITDNAQTWNNYVTIPYVKANTTKDFSYVIKQECSQGDIQWEFSIDSFEEV